jgi:large subunit ribosomal protein LX
MSQFTVSGRFRTRDGWSPFETAIEAANESVAEEHAYATLGSRHGLKRPQIEIDGVDPA